MTKITTARRAMAVGAVSLLAYAVIGTAAITTASAAPAPLSVTASFKVNVGVALPCLGFHIVGAGAATGGVLGGTGTWNNDECAALTFTAHGTLTLGASNGSLLYIVYNARTTSVGVGLNLQTPSLAVTLHDVGTFTITGGTGGFAHATGSGSLLAVANVVSAQGTAQLNGTIDLGSPSP